MRTTKPHEFLDRRACSDRGEVLELDGLDPEESALVDEIFELEEQALARGEISPVAFRYAGRRR